MLGEEMGKAAFQVARRTTRPEKISRPQASRRDALGCTSLEQKYIKPVPSTVLRVRA